MLKISGSALGPSIIAHHGACSAGSGGTSGPDLGGVNLDHGNPATL